MKMFGIHLQARMTIKLGELKNLQYMVISFNYLMYFSLIGIDFSLLFIHIKSALSHHDPWNGLATLMTLLETVVDANKDYLVLEKEEGRWKSILVK
jgi:hypothetical protein